MVTGLLKSGNREAVTKKSLKDSQQKQSAKAERIRIWAVEASSELLSS